MSHYRAFIIGDDGHFKSAQEFLSDSDTSALEHARQFAKENPVEVWQEARRIGMIEKNANAEQHV
jgi:hypothetical protein